MTNLTSKVFTLERDSAFIYLKQPTENSEIKTRKQGKCGVLEILVYTIL